MASAMDGVTDVKMAIAMSKLGGLAVLNLEGVQTRYDNPDEVLTEIANAYPGRRYLPDAKSLFPADQGQSDRRTHPRRLRKPEV